jgi:hypothetical protein
MKIGFSFCYEMLLVPFAIIPMIYYKVLKIKSGNMGDEDFVFYTNESIFYLSS